MANAANFDVSRISTPGYRQFGSCFQFGFDVAYAHSHIEDQRLPLMQEILNTLSESVQYMDWPAAETCFSWRWLSIEARLPRE